MARASRRRIRWRWLESPTYPAGRLCMLHGPWHSDTVVVRSWRFAASCNRTCCSTTIPGSCSCSLGRFKPTSFRVFCHDERRTYADRCRCRVRCFTAFVARDFYVRKKRRVLVFYTLWDLRCCSQYQSCDDAHASLFYFIVFIIIFKRMFYSIPLNPSDCGNAAVMVSVTFGGFVVTVPDLGMPQQDGGLKTPWFCSFRLWRFINHLLTYVFTYIWRFFACFSIHKWICLEKYWTYFHQTFSIGFFWNTDECFKFWDQTVKVQGHRSKVLENALLASSTWCLKNRWTEFHQTFSDDAFCDKDEHVSFGGRKVKGQGHSMPKGPAGGITQSLAPCVEFWFLVLQ